MMFIEWNKSGDLLLTVKPSGRPTRKSVSWGGGGLALGGSCKSDQMEPDPSVDRVRRRLAGDTRQKQPQETDKVFVYFSSGCPS